MPCTMPNLFLAALRSSSISLVHVELQHELVGLGPHEAEVDQPERQRSGHSSGSNVEGMRNSNVGAKGDHTSSRLEREEVWEQCGMDGAEALLANPLQAGAQSVHLGPVDQQPGVTADGVSSAWLSRG
eukprot:UN3131